MPDRAGPHIVGFFIKERLGLSFGDNSINYLDAPVTVRRGVQWSRNYLPDAPPGRGDYAITVAVANGTQHDHVQNTGSTTPSCSAQESNSALRFIEFDDPHHLSTT
jgi:hypothetical protein